MLLIYIQIHDHIFNGKKYFYHYALLILFGLKTFHNQMDFITYPLSQLCEKEQQSTSVHYSKLGITMKDSMYLSSELIHQL